MILKVLNFMWDMSYIASLQRGGGGVSHDVGSLINIPITIQNQTVSKVRKVTLIF